MRFRRTGRRALALQESFYPSLAPVAAWLHGSSNASSTTVPSPAQATGSNPPRTRARGTVSRRAYPCRTIHPNWPHVLANLTDEPRRIVS